MREPLDCADAGEGFGTFDVQILLPFLVVFLVVWGWLCLQFLVCLVSLAVKQMHEHRRYKVDLAAKPRDPAVVVIAGACICRFVYFLLLAVDTSTVGNGSCAALGATIVASIADQRLTDDNNDLKRTTFGYAKGPFVNLLFYPIMLAGYTLVYALWYHQTIAIATAHKKNQALRKKATTFDGGAPPSRGPKMLVDTDALSYDSLQMFFGLQCGLVLSCFFFLASSTANPLSHRTLIDSCAIMIGIGMLIHSVIFLVYGRVLSYSQEAHLTNLEYRYHKMELSVLGWLLVAIAQFVAQADLDGTGRFVLFIVTCFLELYASLNLIASLYSRDDIARKPRAARKSIVRASNDVESAAEAPAALPTIPEQPKSGWGKWVLQLEPFALVLACEAIDRHETVYHAKASTDPSKPASNISASGQPTTNEKQNGPDGWMTLHQSTAIAKILDGEVVNPVQTQTEEATPSRAQMQHQTSARMSGRSLYSSNKSLDASSSKNIGADERATGPIVDRSPSVTPKSSVAGGSLTQRPSDSLTGRNGHRKSVIDRVSGWISDSRQTSESRQTEDVARSQTSLGDLNEAMRIFAKFGVQKALPNAKPTDTMLAIKAKMFKSVLVEFGYWPREDEVMGWQPGLVASNDFNLITFGDFVSWWQCHPLLSAMSLVDDALRPRRKAAQIFTKHLLSFAREEDEKSKAPVLEEAPELVVASVPTPVVQLAQLVLDGVLPPQVLPNVYAELNKVFEEQEKLTLPTMDAFLLEVDAAQAGSVFFHDYIRIVSSVVADQTAFEAAPLPLRSSRSAHINAQDDILKPDSKFEVTL